MSNLDEVKTDTQTLRETLAAALVDLDDAEVGLSGLLDNSDAAFADATSQLSAANATIRTQQAIIDDLRAKLAALTPLPPPSLTAYTITLQNMSEKWPGVYHSTNLGAPKAIGGQVAVVQVALASAVKPGQTLVVEYDQTTNVIFDGTKNIKDQRNWGGPTNYPNDYTGRGIGTGAHQLTYEDGKGTVVSYKGNPAAWTTAYFDMPIKKDVKQHIKRTIRYASVAEKADGYAKIEVDGAIVFEGNGFLVCAPVSQVDIQMVYAPLAGDSGPMPAGSYLQIENISVKVS